MSWFKPAPLPGAGWRVIASEVAPPEEERPRSLAARAVKVALALLVAGLVLGAVIQLLR